MDTVNKKFIRHLVLPKPGSRKRDNGRLLIIAGSDKYFGALVFAIKTASRVSDLVYLLTTPENQKLIKKLKIQTAEFMPTDSSFFPSPLGGEGVRRAGEGAKVLSDIDCILVGPGMGTLAATKKLTAWTLSSGKKAVLDADALNVLDNKLKTKLSPLHILTPHHKEFQRLFKIKPTERNVSLMAKKYRCTIILKGPADIIASPAGKIVINKTGNAGMTKGGTGDVLAGLIAGLYATNDTIASAAAGCYINGLAGDELYKRVGTFYNAEDLANQIPLTMHRLIKRS